MKCVTSSYWRFLRILRLKSAFIHVHTSIQSTYMYTHWQYLKVSCSYMTALSPACLWAVAPCRLHDSWPSSWVLLLFISLPCMLSPAQARQKPRWHCCLSKLLMSKRWSGVWSTCACGYDGYRGSVCAQPHIYCTSLSLSKLEVYLLVSHAALLSQPASIGAVCSHSLHFYCSSPLPLLHPPSFTLSTVWTSLTQWLLSTEHLSPPGFLHVIFCPSETIYYSLLHVLPSLLLSHADDMWAGGIGLKGSSLLWISEWRGEVSVSPSHHSGGALEAGGEHHWCTLHPLERRQDSPRRKQTDPRVRLDVLCVGRQKAATEGGEHLARGTRFTGVWGRWGVGSAGSVLKVKGGVEGGVCCALRSKNWKNEDCFSLWRV